MGMAGSKGVEADEAGRITRCLFCTIANQEDTTPREACRTFTPAAAGDVTPVFFRDERVAVFYTRSPQGTEHMLVVPRTHVGTVADLPSTPGAGDLLDHMRAVGLELMADVDGGGAVQTVFHVPPFNSINHLHLHVFALPFRSLKAQIMYAPRSLLGIQWCASFDAIRANL